eukprot:g628.t1
MPKRRRKSRAGPPVRSATGSTFIRCPRCEKSFHAILFSSHHCKPVLKKISEQDTEGVEVFVPPKPPPKVIPTVDITMCTDDGSCNGPCCVSSWTIVKHEAGVCGVCDSATAGNEPLVRHIDLSITAPANSTAPVGLVMCEDGVGGCAIVQIVAGSPAAHAVPSLQVGDVVLRVGASPVGSGEASKPENVVPLILAERQRVGSIRMRVGRSDNPSPTVMAAVAAAAGACIAKPAPTPDIASAPVQGTSMISPFAQPSASTTALSMQIANDEGSKTSRKPVTRQKRKRSGVRKRRTTGEASEVSGTNAATTQFDVEENCWYVVHGCERVAGPFELHYEAAAAANKVQSAVPCELAEHNCEAAAAANVLEKEIGLSQKAPAAGGGMAAHDIVDLT